MNHIIIPLNAFEREMVLEKGQAAFISLIAESGAYGVEIRQELLRDKTELAQLNQVINETNLFPVYSTPTPCWGEDASFNQQALEEVLTEAKQLGAKWVKISLGHFHPEKSQVAALGDFIAKYPDIQLLVENDQSIHGGNIASMKAFFEKVTEQKISVQMTFDVGNWYFSNQEVEEALQSLAPYVRYIHLKQVEERAGQLTTLSLNFKSTHSWMKVVEELPADMEKGFEFPIEPKVENIKYYIQGV